LIAVALAVAASFAPVAQAGGPDDRAVYRGTSSALVAGSLGPDDHAFARNVHEIDPGVAPVNVIVRGGGFDWADAAIGGTFGLAVAMLGLGALLIAQRRRSTLTPA
jgi:hypothetical protein